MTSVRMTIMMKSTRMVPMAFIPLVSMASGEDSRFMSVSSDGAPGAGTAAPA
jgi:hypothetical protein